MENVIILGSGCAGLTAAIYAARASLEPIVVSGHEAGGQLMLTTEVENFPGFPEGIMGPQLIENMKKQAERFGARFKTGNASDFVKKEGHIELKVGEEVLQTKTLIVATGASARLLGLESERKYIGRGVSTCATCDAFFFKDKVVCLVGGGDSACEEAHFISRFASKVYLIHRRDKLRASKIMQDRVLKNDKIEILWNKQVTEVLGDDKKVTGVKLQDTVDNSESNLDLDGVFIAIGHIPNTKMFNGQLDVDEHGFLLTNKLSHTSMEGVYAAGDVQDPVFKQAITSAGAGCQAAISAEKYLEALEDE